MLWVGTGADAGASPQVVFSLAFLGTVKPAVCRQVSAFRAVCTARGRIWPWWFCRRERRKQTKSTDGNPQAEGDILVIYLKCC